MKNFLLELRVAIFVFLLFLLVVTCSESGDPCAKLLQMFDDLTQPNRIRRPLWTWVQAIPTNPDQTPLRFGIADECTRYFEVETPAQIVSARKGSMPTALTTHRIISPNLLAQ